MVEGAAGSVSSAAGGDGGKAEAEKTKRDVETSQEAAASIGPAGVRTTTYLVRCIMWIRRELQAGSTQCPPRRRSRRPLRHRRHLLLHRRRRSSRPAGVRSKTHPVEVQAGTSQCRRRRRRRSSRPACVCSKTHHPVRRTI